MRGALSHATKAARLAQIRDVRSRFMGSIAAKPAPRAARDYHAARKKSAARLAKTLCQLSACCGCEFLSDAVFARRASNAALFA
jgi:hypothetical protein